jgi:tRNA (mo5U34)-methyltransferase
VQKVICEEALLDPQGTRAQEPSARIEPESRTRNIGGAEIPFTATSGDLPVTKKKMEDILWFHQVPLPDGRITPGVAAHYLLESNYLFDRLDFKGKSVLDIGCWDGYFSFMAEKRGAARVVGLDNPDFRVGGEDGFQFLHEIFNSSVEWRRGSVFDLPISERFDIVLCYGVIYHINDPLTAIINCFQVANERVVFEGLIFESNLPALVLLAPGEIGGDVSNIHTASTEYLKNVAELNGFRLVEQRLFPMTPSNPKLDRGTMMFERYAEKRPAYLPTCFSLAPSCFR